MEVAGTLYEALAWAAGSFQAGDIRKHDGLYYRRTAAGSDSASENPAANTADWDPLDKADWPTVSRPFTSYSDYFHLFIKMAGIAWVHIEIEGPSTIGWVPHPPTDGINGHIGLKIDALSGHRYRLVMTANRGAAQLTNSAAYAMGADQ